MVRDMIIAGFGMKTNSGGDRVGSVVFCNNVQVYDTVYPLISVHFWEKAEK